MKLAKQQQLTVQADEAEIQLFVPAQLFWFKGHFPLQPLLPGVAQLEWVLYYARQLFAQKSSIKTIDVIKFQRPILPNATLFLQLSWQPESQRLSFRYLCQGEVASSGKLTLC